MKNWAIDKGLLLAILFFMGLGLVQVYSSSFIFATEAYGDGLLFFRRQLMFISVGLTCLTVVSMLPWKFVERYGVVLWVIAVVLLILTFVPGLGIKGGGGGSLAEVAAGTEI